MKGWENRGGAETTEVHLFTPTPFNPYCRAQSTGNTNCNSKPDTEIICFIEGRHWMHSTQAPYFCQGIFTPSDPTHKGYSCSAFSDRTLSLIVLCVQRYSGNDLPIPVQESGKKP